MTLTGVTSERLAGEPLARVYPHLRGLTELAFHDLDAEWLAGAADVVFLALPHMESQRAVPVLRARGRKVIDLSADYRLRDPRDYVTWYKAPHVDAERARRGGVRAARAASEGDRRRLAGGLARAAIRWARSWRWRRCSRAGWRGCDGIVIDGKSGVTGAGAQGRKVDPMYLYTEANENVQAYGIGVAPPHAGDRAGAVGAGRQRRWW